jgi:outer membrane receptor for ferrienterochelin and colicins
VVLVEVKKRLLGIAGCSLATLAFADPNVLFVSRTTQSIPLGDSEVPASAKIVVSGAKTDKELRRESVAGKIIIGRKSIEESGTSSAYELLKREPAITVSSGGRLGLLGLPGMTQILVDGVASSGSKSPLELDLVHIERIEIIKSSLAEFGPYGIAGTINIVTRKLIVKKTSRINLSGNTARDGDNANFSLSSSVLPPDSPVRISLTASGGWSKKNEESELFSAQLNLDTSKNDIINGFTAKKNISANLFLSGIIEWKLNSRHEIEIEPALFRVDDRAHLNENNVWVSIADLVGESQQISRKSMQSATLPLKWTYKPDSTSKLIVRVIPTRVDSDAELSHSNVYLSAASVDGNSTQKSRTNHEFLKADYSLAVFEGHDIKAGLTLGRNSLSHRFSYWKNGFIDHSLDSLGAVQHIIDKKRSYYVQNDWQLSEMTALNFGVSEEFRQVRIAEGGYTSRARYHLIAPSANLAWKLDAKGNRQVRLGLARTFKAPYLDQLPIRPEINPYYPCSTHLCGGNNIDRADTSGNPDLQPERSDGGTLTYEHYFGEDSIVSIDFFSRDLRNVIGVDIELLEVPWSTVRRFVSRPNNLGSAWTRGIGVEVKLQLRDFWKTAPKIGMYSAINVARSRLSTLAGPDNRMEDQSPWSAKLGGSYAAEDLPLSLSVDANWVPGVWTRTSRSMRIYSDRRADVSVQATWDIGADLRLRFDLANLAARKNKQLEEFTSLNNALVRTRERPTYMKFGGRLELKF